MIYLFFGNDCYKLFYCNFFFREKMRFYHDSVDVTSSKYKTFDFHYFLKAVHEEIDCINQPVCKIFNFRLSLERVHFHEKKSFKEKKEFSVVHCIKQENQQVFHSMFKWSANKDQLFLNNFEVEDKRKTT